MTVRANIERLVGGAGEETIVARVGEGIVTTVGSAETHKAVLENPDLISRTVLSKGLDAGTAFEILSIDIADVDVGRNIGAQLQMDQAEADCRIAQAKAEERRAMAVAREQEMKAAAQTGFYRGIAVMIMEAAWARSIPTPPFPAQTPSLSAGKTLAGPACGAGCIAGSVERGPPRRRALLPSFF